MSSYSALQFKNALEKKMAKKKKEKRLARQKNWNDRRQREKGYLLLQEQNDFQRVEGKQAIKRGKIKKKQCMGRSIQRT